MYFADEVRSPSSELPNLPDGEAPSDREIKMAELLIESMEGSWDPERYHDTHRQKVESLIEEKRHGRAIVTSAAAPASKVVDLMAALSASIKAQSTTAKPAARKSAAAAKASAKRAEPKVSPQNKVAKAPAARSPRRKAS
jgi:DNA end-binding protein Ku